MAGNVYSVEVVHLRMVSPLYAHKIPCTVYILRDKHCTPEIGKVAWNVPERGYMEDDTKNMPKCQEK